MADTIPSIAAYFWSKVSIPETQADCWSWAGSVNEKGYGRFWDGRSSQWRMAHRVAYEFLKGDIPDGQMIRHLCHNRLCCNPAHLEPGTAKDNAQDAVEAGRFTRGSVNGNSKLTDEMVLYIRRNPDGLKGRAIADKLGISPATVSEVKNGKVWRHVAA